MVYKMTCVLSELNVKCSTSFGDKWQDIHVHCTSSDVCVWGGGGGVGG